MIAKFLRRADYTLRCDNQFMDDELMANCRPLRSLLDLPASRWREVLDHKTGAGYRGDQIANWVFKHGVFSFDDMENVPQKLRRDLAARYTVVPPEVAARFESVDGTQRFLLELQDGQKVESVYMPYSDRVTLCISSQVGCRFACTFCQTGSMGLQRSLTAGEIVGQVLRLRAERGWLSRPVNVVFMGQGEPLDNIDAVIPAIQALQDPAGPGLSWRRITVSTVGIVSAIQRLSEMGDSRPRLAVSLNASTDEVRSEIMPINRRWPIEVLLSALRDVDWRKGERVTFEYVMLSGINDGTDHARRLGDLLRGLPAKVNLIPWNSVSMLPYRRPSLKSVERFRVMARATGLDVLVRYSRGADIAAACGQLHTSEVALPPDTLR